MTRKFRTADYDAMLNVKVSLGDALPPDHLARVIGMPLRLSLYQKLVQFGLNSGYAQKFIIAACHQR